MDPGGPGSAANCYPSCAAWPAFGNLYYYNNMAGQPLQYQINNAVNQWDAVRTVQEAPYLHTTDTPGGIPIGQRNPDGACARGHSEYRDGSPDPLLFPPRNQWTLVSGAYISVSLPTPPGCEDEYSVILHEMGHTLGLGHTTASNQVMSQYLSNIDTPQSRDQCGFNRTYKQISC